MALYTTHEPTNIYLYHNTDLQFPQKYVFNLLSIVFFSYPNKIFKI